MLNQVKSCYATRCVMCDAEISVEEGHQFDELADLCLNCRYRSESAPELFANCIERFLIGNVL
jgi:hypothetical protein